jgi:hypothetical protein
MLVYLIPIGYLLLLVGFIMERRKKRGAVVVFTVGLVLVPIVAFGELLNQAFLNHHQDMPGIGRPVWGLHGVLTNHYEDGSLRSETHFEDGWRHGLDRAWYRDGRLQFRGNYEQGTQVGTWEGWRPDGRPDYVNEFDDQGRWASWTNWHDNRVMKSRGVPMDETGRLEVTFYYEDGSVECAGERESYNEGEWGFWTPDGRLDPSRSGVYKNGRRVLSLRGSIPRPDPVPGPVGPPLPRTEGKNADEPESP